MHTIQRSAVSGQRGGRLELIRVGLMLGLVSGLAMWLVPSGEAMQNAPVVQYITPKDAKDLNGDLIADAIVAAPDGEDGLPSAGLVQVYLGNAEVVNLLVTFTGEAIGDRFGAAVEFIGDLDGDGNEDVLIGAPATPMGGTVYLFSGPYAGICPPIVAASRAGKIIDKPDADVYDFGFSVGPLYDFDGDGYADFRVAAHYLDAAGVEQTRTYIYNGLIGYPVATITGAVGVDGLAPLPGDADGDGVVTLADMAKVATNLGGAGNLSPAKGDVVPDGTVDATDIALVANQQGSMLYQGNGIAPPAGFACDSMNGCPSYAVQDANGEWSCIREMNCSSPQILIIDESGNLAWVQSPDSDPIYPGQQCDTLRELCLFPQYLFPGSPLFKARDLVLSRCGSVPSLEVICRTDCPRRVGGATLLLCDPVGSGSDNRKVIIYICVNPSDINISSFCLTLAHELVHLSQACLCGYYDQQNDCHSVLQDWNNQYHNMCQEYEAYTITGECTTLQNCCEKACSNEGNWQDCSQLCTDCCQIGAEACCVNGKNECLDGTGPSPFPCYLLPL